MLTPQQVAEKTFNANDKRATGYDMQEVDAFMDEITADYSALVNENADLRIKLKLLADKVTEYRETENAIRATLYTAQKTASNLVKEAQQKRETILSALEEDLRSRKELYDQEIADCHERLAAARAQTAEYVERARQITGEHQRYLDALPPEIVGGALGDEDEYEEYDAAVEAAQEAAEEAAQESAAESDEVQPDEAEAGRAPLAIGDAQAFADIPAAGESAPAARIDFSNLKFGKDYEV